MSDVHILYTLFGSAEEARHVAKAMIEERLVACANHLAPAMSQYQWDGEFCEEQEYPVLFKTGANRVEAAMAKLRELHSYDTPAILSWPAERADADYAAWVKEQVGE